jgi:anti-sigma factor (TIGR02949 family)
MANRDECRSIVRHLWAYLDGELPDELQERVAAHLEECTTCRSHFDFERALLAAIRVHGGASSDAEFEPLRTRVVLAIAQQDFLSYRGPTNDPFTEIR